MVRRVELLFFLLFLLLLGIATNTQFQTRQEDSQTPQVKKKVEIAQGDLREINATGLLNEYRSSEAFLLGKVWYFRSFALKNPQIRLLRSDRAKREENRIFMEGNVTLKRQDGSVFRADSVTYRDREKILQSQGPFYGHKGESYVRGEDLYYDLLHKVTRAQKVFAHYRLGEKFKEKNTPQMNPPKSGEVGGTSL